MRTLIAAVLATLVLAPSAAPAQRAGDAGGPLRIALAKQPFSPTGTSPGPTTMARGGIQQALAQLGAVVRVDEGTDAMARVRQGQDGLSSGQPGGELADRPDPEWPARASLDDPGTLAREISGQ
jgi:hypothetical protein